MRRCYYEKPGHGERNYRKKLWRMCKLQGKDESWVPKKTNPPVRNDLQMAPNWLVEGISGVLMGEWCNFAQANLSLPFVRDTSTYSAISLEMSCFSFGSRLTQLVGIWIRFYFFSPMVPIQISPLLKECVGFFCLFFWGRGQTQGLAI
jgi:hypothetical protein